MTHCCAEYIWLDAKDNFRSKSRTLTFNPENVSEIPIWNYDGSSTGQADGHDSEVILHPVAKYPDPFRKEFGSQHILVLCETRLPDGTSLPNNHRPQALKQFDENCHYPWYGFEQEYFLIHRETKRPIGFPADPQEEPAPQGPYYCGVGYGTARGRKLVEEHYQACLYSGLQISGINAEVAPGQWEFQIGPAEEISAGDQLLVGRYLLVRVAEKYQVSVSFHSKPVSGNWNGSGCHANFSTVEMREGSEDGVNSGIDFINRMVSEMFDNHIEHMRVYGDDNLMRMTGEHETSDYYTFTSGVADRGASVRIPNQIAIDKCGYLEDRRPSSSCNPYLVSHKLYETYLKSYEKMQSNETNETSETSETNEPVNLC